MVVIFLKGNVPSLKNSKQWVPKIKKLLPSKTVVKYCKEYEYQFELQKDAFFKGIEGKELPFKIELHFVRNSRHKFDFINACQIVFDLMVKHGWIVDDDMDNLIPFPFKMDDKWYSYDKEDPGVYIVIR